MTTTIWECKIGEVHSAAGGADYLMRQAVADAYKAQTGVEPVFIFSGWGASLTEAERAVVENRLPAPATAPAQPERTPMTKEQREQVARRAEAAMNGNVNLSWRDALMSETEAFHDIKETP